MTAVVALPKGLTLMHKMLSPSHKHHTLDEVKHVLFCYVML